MRLDAARESHRQPLLLAAMFAMLLAASLAATARADVLVGEAGTGAACAAPFPVD
jgi:hypothetical protein